MGRGRKSVDFDLNEDEAMLKSLVERFASDRYDLDRRRCYQAHPQGFSPQNWTMLGQLGLVAAPYSVEAGGMSASPTDIIVVFEAMGRALVVEPLCDASILAGGIFEQGAPPELAAEWAPALTQGRRRLALAHQERNARASLSWVETRVSASGNRLVLNGCKAGVAHAVGADGFIVSGRRPDRDDLELYLVAAGTPGLSMEPYRRIDGAAAANLRLDDVEVTESACIAGGLVAIEDGEARAGIARLAEALGVMETLFAATLDYLRQRQQFGVAIGSFQAIQHRMVAQYVALEQARSLLYLAALAPAKDRGAWLRSIAGARAFIGEASVALGHEAIQLHGGMGVSDELMVGHAHKRIMMLARTTGGPDAALDRYAGVPSA